MKSTGMVRNIDSLGRVVVPKEIRRTLNFFNGDSLEIFLEGEMVCLKKYNAEQSIKVTIESLIKNIDVYYNIKNAKDIKEKLKEVTKLLPDY